MQTSLVNKTLMLACTGSLFFSCTRQAEPKRPNILFCIADDQSFPNAGAYGCDWIKTPSFDRVAKEGILFMNAYTPNAKCAPSRACIITGRNSWQLEEAANHVCNFPAKFKTYAEVLKENGYFTGYTAKGWAPGDPGKVNGKERELLGPQYSELKTDPPTRNISPEDYAANFEAFLDANKENKPFCFWYGCREPHRPYEFRSGIDKGGKKTGEVDSVYEFWPDVDTVRADLLDYAYEVEYFDHHLGKMLGILKERGLLDNTLVIVTADNGMPFPRVKGQEYEYSNHLPLAMMWKDGIRDPGRRYDAFVSFTDFAPTYLDLAGIKTEASGMKPMEGRSLLPVLKNENDTNRRDFMVIGKERHDVGRPNDEGYPIRGIISDGYLYLKNFKPDRWPAGNPETGYLNCDGSPVKSFILNARRRDGHSLYWDLAFGRRSSEELYKISTDPACMLNLASSPDLQNLKQDLSRRLTAELKKEGDPRMSGNGDIFDQYLYAEEANRDFYNRFMAGEKMKAGWVSKTDFEKKGDWTKK